MVSGLVRSGSVVLLALVVALAALVSSPRPAPAVAAAPAYAINDGATYIYVPSNATRFQPIQILVAMHGMGGEGARFCQDLLATADRYGWIIVAPTFSYQDFRNPALVLQDDLAFLPRLLALIDSVPGRTGLATRDKVLLYGYSRGGQSAHRFATFYPERTLGVAALSAGSYTLPLQTMVVSGRVTTLPLPYGVADLNGRLGRSFALDAFRTVPFWIAVGGQDSNPADTPRAWDPYLGATRIDRARAYTQALQDIGVTASLAIYADAGHLVTPQMRADALAFLEAQDVAAREPRAYGYGPVRGGLAYAALVTGVMTQRR